MSRTLRVWRVSDTLSDDVVYVDAQTQVMAVAVAAIELNNPESAVIVYEDDED